MPVFRAGVRNSGFINLLFSRNIGCSPQNTLAFDFVAYSFLFCARAILFIDHIELAWIILGNPVKIFISSETWGTILKSICQNEENVLIIHVFFKIEYVMCLANFILIKNKIRVKLKTTTGKTTGWWEKCYRLEKQFLPKKDSVCSIFFFSVFVREIIFFKNYNDRPVPYEITLGMS